MSGLYGMENQAERISDAEARIRYLEQCVDALLTGNIYDGYDFTQVAYAHRARIYLDWISNGNAFHRYSQEPPYAH